ncbi:hypothetical protein MANES_16G116800v8 [Manihot esculenta]|uniref:Uncharacterized protein n=1 Tax=Manihot esculenta TaxID=3983 RepID=A0A2C9UC09_MANES|nr:hypothetical protein MANES_16G116800v8 [Manihot esculenta]
MCNPAVRFISHRAFVEERRWLVFQAVDTVTEQPRTETAAVGGATGGSIGRCICSPTRHPGSFRCRHHRADYAWGRRITK